jgi:SAM-dependent methyltransferase
VNDRATGPGPGDLSSVGGGHGPPASFDVVTSRHFLWTLREPAKAMASWRNLLRPGGRLVAVDGFWFTGSGESEAPPRAGPGGRRAAHLHRHAALIAGHRNRARDWRPRSVIAKRPRVNHLGC